MNTLPKSRCRVAKSGHLTTRLFGGKTPESILSGWPSPRMAARLGIGKAERDAMFSGLSFSLKDGVVSANGTRSANNTHQADFFGCIHPRL